MTGCTFIHTAFRRSRRMLWGVGLVVCVAARPGAGEQPRDETRAAELERMSAEYIRLYPDHFMDRDGLIYSCVDRTTMRPFTQEFYETQVWSPHAIHENRADFLAYEDTMNNMGVYLDMLKYAYLGTGDAYYLDEIHRVCRLLVRIFDKSQSIEPGFFKRPYGGLGAVRQRQEPLGTDQAYAILAGTREVYDLLEPDLQAEVKRMTVDSLLWYARQGYRYVYYHIHYHAIEAGPFDKGTFGGRHALSYYVPALLWCYEITGERRFIDDYHWMFDRYIRDRDLSENARAFSRWWGLLVTSELAPEEHQPFFRDLTEQMMSRYLVVLDRLAEHNSVGPGYTSWLEPDWSFVFNPPDLPDLDKEGTLRQRGDMLRSWIRYAPLMQIRDIVHYAGQRPGAVNLDTVKRVLVQADTPYHFCYYYDPTESVLPPKMRFYDRYMVPHSYSGWLGAYWRMRHMERE